MSLALRPPPRWFFGSLVPLAAGLLWLIIGWNAAWPAAVLASVPGLVLIACGLALLLWPGDRYITHYLALVSPVGIVLAMLMIVWLGPVDSVLLVLAAIASFLTAGYAALLQQPLPAGVPVPDVRLSTLRKAATDEALLGFFVSCAHIPTGDEVARDAYELGRMRVLGGQPDGPASFERLAAAPPAPEAARIRRRRAHGCDFEWLTFDSGFVPDPALPGSARWRAHRPNQRMAARVLRHPGGPRPWLICIHGYRMGIDALDSSLFGIRHMHDTLGMNLIMPILPLHGCRSIARITGGHFFDGPLVDLVHAQAQALWDIRRCLAWVHATQPGAQVGTLGYSLGGYNAALLASVEPSLACVIAGIPVVDIPATVWAHMPLVHQRYIESQGIDARQLSAMMAPVSPLSRRCAVPHERRYLFAATADQLVSPEQPLALWRHWEEPAMHWYHGSHLSVRQESGGRSFVERALAESGLSAAP